jgi:pimeloyl-ACP methyl ester carboxylesterase
MAHGLGGIRGMRLDAFAEQFCQAGYACLVFDYRHFGGSEGQPRQLLDVHKQLEDWRAAIAYARSRDDIDCNRLILWGTSFGGGHVLATAAADQNISAVISQCPFTDGLASSLASPAISAIKVTALAIWDQIGAWLGLKPTLVATSGRPGTTALMTAPDAEPGYLQLVPKASEPIFRNQVAARVALQVMRYFPGRKAAKIVCPVLFCVCETDTVAPAKTTLRHAKRAPKGRIVLYPFGHFDIYVGQAFDRAVRDQIEFLNRTVPLC